MQSKWLLEREQFQKLAASVLPPDAVICGSLKDALQFAELLTLVPDTAGATRLVKEETDGALAFLEVIAEMTDAIETAEGLPSTSELNGPFHELADFVVEFLEGVRELDPAKFE